MRGMAYYDCDFKEVDILEVKSVSDMISAFKTSAADAAKLTGRTTSRYSLPDWASWP